MNQDENTWPASWLLTLFFYCVDHSKLSIAVCFIKWGWSLLCCMAWDFPSII